MGMDLQHFQDKFNHNSDYGIQRAYCGNTWYIWVWICTVFQDEFNHNNDYGTIYDISMDLHGFQGEFNCNSVVQMTIIQWLCNYCYSWIHLEKQCRFMPISYIATIGSLDYIITVMVEFVLKNATDPYPYHVLPQ